jgi:hypothetical protein
VPLEAPGERLPLQEPIQEKRESFQADESRSSSGDSALFLEVSIPFIVLEG